MVIDFLKHLLLALNNSLRIESPQIHIPNGADVLKLCFKLNNRESV